MANCFLCGKFYRAETPIYKCDCGQVNMVGTNRYVIDFTLKKHGEFIMHARTEEEAQSKFDMWLQCNRKQTEEFIDHLTFDTEVKTNYVVLAAP